MIDPRGTTGGSTLVLGGARSGKSRHAQALAEAAGGRLVYVATAQAFDDEMADRISRHQADRDARWTTVEAPLDLAATVARHASPDVTLLVDCLTLWTSNLLLAEKPWELELDALTAAVASNKGRMILVSNEVGLGIVPDNALARRFRDMAGTINQKIAAVATHVHFVAAGLSLVLK